MSARIDGASWNAVAVSTATLSAIRTMTIGGADLQLSSGSSRTILVSVLNAAVGTFQISNGGAVGTVNIVPGGSWMADRVAGGSGSVTITSLTSTGAVGTFAFTAPPQAGSGATGNKVITDGVFNVTF